MKKVAALGITDFEDILKRNVFYVDKTDFIKEWWNRQDQVTLIARPRRFGKTLMLNMLEKFFSNQYAGRSDLFQGFSIWKNEEFQGLQGSFPVINFSFANIKQQSYASMKSMIAVILSELFERHAYLLKSAKLSEGEKSSFLKITEKRANDEEYINALKFLAVCLYKHFDRKVLIFIDEYDTPMLEAYTAGYWEDAIIYMRRFFHAAFKENVYLERGMLTGITRITQESVFSDLNNLRVVTTTEEIYETSFGFTEEEVFSALEEFCLLDRKDEVKEWYDGFQFGTKKDIYNPWSILNFLADQKLKPYWMNTSSNALAGQLVQRGTLKVKDEFEILLNGGSIFTEIDEAITYAELRGNSKTIWSWFLTTGYVRIINKQEDKYEIALTNYEVREAFYKLVKRWFDDAYDEYTEFIRMLLQGNVGGMQRYMEKVTMQTFSYFDVGNGYGENEKTEQFYHGFTLGLMADLNQTHILTSNRESGFGRYDVCIEPLDKTKEGILIEFKVFDSKTEKGLEDTARRALKQIEEKRYEEDLKARGITKVKKYGFAFSGKDVLICGLDK